MAVNAEGIRPLLPLKDNQALASDPETHVWLSASAGTGKTHVLASRVFRLLLSGVDPGAILCLTFTKAGATEMAGRVSDRLAAWVRMSAEDLTRDLYALGERPTPALQARARTLFARVLDTPGGLRIQTIHGFCQALLAAFPVEAGLVPGFRPMEARDEALLAREALSAMLVTAEAEGRDAPVRAISALSVRLGEGGAEGFLAACARAGAALDALPAGVQPFVRRALSLPTGDIEAAIVAACGDDVIDRAALDAIARLNRDWGTKSGVARAEAIGLWLAAAAEERAATLSTLHEVWATAKGDPRSMKKGQAPDDPAYADLALRMHGRCGDLLGLRVQAAYADLLAAGLEVGRDYARAYAAAKRAAGAVDFDDLIARAVVLLEKPGIGEWVRFKLDQATEHVLIDEAQDTNVNQWRIVQAIVAEFFVGRGQHAPGTRTLFTVGDYKQAIFGFQGTDPAYFADAARYFAEKIILAQGDDDLPEEERGLPLAMVSLTHSFRSTRPVLEFVDAAVDVLGAAALGLGDVVKPHASMIAGPGKVTLLTPTIAGAGDDIDAGEEGWTGEQERDHASRIARLVRGWLDAGAMLESKGRPIRPADIMILVKRRGDLARLLVARLHAEGVAVAGVDRLRLNAPLAVQDLLAAIRFVLQPEDDLSLAGLLVSPLIGWTQDELLARSVPRPGGLWRHLQQTRPAGVEVLEAMLARGDFVTPYRFLEDLLSGPLDGRRRLLERLGEEARDPIEELLNAALDFETVATPSLQRFLDWFDRGDVEIVREAGGPVAAVRVMTAHAAKGLQAPVVILADATIDPDRSPRAILQWVPDTLDAPLPVIRPRSGERIAALEPVVAAAAAKEREEHWRLLYVAATRAEEQLFIAGALSPRDKGEAPAASWYAAARNALGALAAERPDTVARLTIDKRGEALVFTGLRPDRPAAMTTAAMQADPAVDLPAWARLPAPVEARPSRPLAPSSLGEDAVADPPPTPAMRAAAEHGRLFHALFERLPAVMVADRAVAADRWLRDVGQVGDGAERDAIAGRVCAILGDPAHAALFGLDSLGEAPITAALPDGTVVAGTVDRLLVEPGRVRVIDFKTGRRVPHDAGDVPPYHLRQMAAYAAALAAIFPGSVVEAALLYTAGPRLIDLPAAMLAAHKPGLADREQSLPPGG